MFASPNLNWKNELFIMIGRCLWSCCASAGSLPTKESIIWNIVLIPQGLNWCVNSEIKLLSKVLSCPELWPYIPHSNIVKWNINGCPWPWVYLQMTNKNFITLQFQSDFIPNSIDVIRISRIERWDNIPESYTVKLHLGDCTVLC